MALSGLENRATCDEQVRVRFLVPPHKIWDCDMNKIDTTLYIPELGCTFKQINDRANTPGFNQYGVPYHACYGHIHNEHYWSYVGEHVRRLKEAGMWRYEQ